MVEHIEKKDGEAFPNRDRGTCGDEIQSQQTPAGNRRVFSEQRLPSRRQWVSLLLRANH